MVYKVPENLPYIPKKKYGNYIGKTVVNNFMQTGVNESMWIYCKLEISRTSSVLLWPWRFVFPSLKGTSQKLLNNKQMKWSICVVPQEPGWNYEMIYYETKCVSPCKTLSLTSLLHVRRVIAPVLLRPTKAFHTWHYQCALVSSVLCCCVILG